MTNPRDLVQLRALYQSGLLSEDEYTDARRRLLGYKVKRGKPVPPSATRPPAPPPRPPSAAASARPAERASVNSQRRSVNAQHQGRARNPNSDLPLLFALAALAIVGLVAAVWFLMG